MGGKVGGWQRWVANSLILMEHCTHLEATHAPNSPAVNSGSCIYATHCVASCVYSYRSLTDLCFYHLGARPTWSPWHKELHIAYLALHGWLRMECIFYSMLQFLFCACLLVCSGIQDVSNRKQPKVWPKAGFCLRAWRSLDPRVLTHTFLSATFKRVLQQQSGYLALF